MRPATAALLAPAGLLAVLLIGAPELKLGVTPLTLLGTAGCCLSVYILRTIREPRHAVATSMLSAVLLAAWWNTPGDSDVGLRHFGGAVTGLLAFACVRLTSVSEQTHRLTVQMLSLAAVLALLAGLSSVHVEPTKQVLGLFGSGFWERLPRVELPAEGLVDGMVNSNALAGAALVIGPMLAGLAVSAWTHRRPAESLMPCLGVAISLVCLLVSLSRTASIAAVIIFLAVVMQLSAYARRVALIVVLLIVAAIVVTSQHPDGEQYRYEIMVQSQYTLGQRLGFWQQAVDQIAIHPIRGVGINQFHPSEDAHAENIYLQMMLDLGVPGALVYFAFWTALAVGAWQGRSRDDAGILSGALLSIMAVHLFGVTDAIALGSRVGVFQWVAAGLAAGTPYARDFTADQ